MQRSSGGAERPVDHSADSSAARPANYPIFLRKYMAGDASAECLSKTPTLHSCSVENTLVLKSAIWNLESEISNMESGIWNLKYGTWELKSKIWNPKYEFWNLDSEIWKMKSEICNLKRANLP